MMKTTCYRPFYPEILNNYQKDLQLFPHIVPAHGYDNPQRHSKT